MIAVYYNYQDVVTVLLDNGADPNIMDRDGYTALDWAINFNYMRIAKILRSYGGTANATNYYQSPLDSAEYLELFDDCPILANWRGVFFRNLLTSIIKSNIPLNISKRRPDITPCAVTYLMLTICIGTSACSVLQWRKMTW